MLCPRTVDCSLRDMFVLDSMSQFWARRYCHADHRRCARFRLAAHGMPIPANLLPSGESLRAMRGPLRGTPQARSGDCPSQTTAA